MTFHILKRATKDTGAGAQILNWDARPADLPELLAKAPAKTPFRISLSPANSDMHPTHIFDATRLTFIDHGTGYVTLQLAVVAGTVANEIIYADKGAEFQVDVEPSPDHTEDLMPVSPEERSKTLTRLATVANEPGFIDFLKQRDPDGLIASAEAYAPGNVADAGVEVLLRKISAHSRADIARDALVCERAQRLLREYRETRFGNA